MKIRSLVTAVALGLLASAGTAQARDVEVEISSAPPPDREYVIPAPREGYVYERPHYRWEGDKYVWNDGRYIEEREGHRYEQPKIEHRGEHWYFRSGHWDDDD